MRSASYKRILAAVTLCAVASTACVPAQGPQKISEPPLPAEQIAVSADEAEDSYDDGGYFDTYADKLAEIERRQQELDKQLNGDDEEILDAAATQKIILEEINILNEKLAVINGYMSTMDMKIATERDQANALRAEIDQGVELYKKRLRAMYISGEIGYAEIIFGAGDFFDMLMRTELMQRVTASDAARLDDLVAKKTAYDNKMKQIENEKNVYDDQAAELEREKKSLAELYDSNGETRRALREHKQQLEEDQRVFENEVYSYEGILNDLLLGTYNSDVDEQKRLETEPEAEAAMKSLQEGIEARKKAGETIPDTECQYTFKWPVKDHYEITSGVGARWGSYHTGLDIPGEGGFPITAAEAGEVVRTNNSCTHNYGKYGSCGCGGGYGNFVIIDHGNGFLTLYGHLTQTSVEVGDKVKEGQEIGLMGSTGYSTGTHLHYELRYQGYVTDPSRFTKY